MSVPEPYLFLINQLFDLEKKAAKLAGGAGLQRNIDRMKNKFDELGLLIHNPLGEKYNETRTDCEANIGGGSNENLVITEVVKPIIRLRQDGMSLIVQKAVVVVESAK